MNLNRGGSIECPGRDSRGMNRFNRTVAVATVKSLSLLLQAISFVFLVVSVFVVSFPAVLGDSAKQTKKAIKAVEQRDSSENQGGTYENADAFLRRRGKLDVRLHDPSSIAKCDGEYWLFSTGRGIRSWRSGDLRNWARGPRVFDEKPAWVTDIVPGHSGYFSCHYYDGTDYGRSRLAIRPLVWDADGWPVVGFVCKGGGLGWCD